MKRAGSFILLGVMVLAMSGCAAPMLMTKVATSAVLGTVNSAVRTGMAVGSAAAVSGGKAAVKMAPKAAAMGMLAL